MPFGRRLVDGRSVFADEALPEALPVARYTPSGFGRLALLPEVSDEERRLVDGRLAPAVERVAVLPDVPLAGRYTASGSGRPALLPELLVDGRLTVAELLECFTVTRDSYGRDSNPGDSVPVSGRLDDGFDLTASKVYVGELDEVVGLDVELEDVLGLDTGLL